MVRYVSYSIMQCTNTDTGDYIYALNHWYQSDDSPEIQGCRNSGYFKTRELAEKHHAQMVKEGLET